MSNSSLSRILIVVVAHNEERFIQGVIEGILAQGYQDVLIVDDASTDKTSDIIAVYPVQVIRHSARLGCGVSVRSGIDFSIKKNFDIVVIMAGNGKDLAVQIPALVSPILNKEADLVQGSRYLSGGQHENMPFHRMLGTRAYSWIFTLLTRTKITDGTNGFKAVRTDVFKDSKINLWQDWLNGPYEIESYFFCKAILCGWRIKEVPVLKRYPIDLKQGYTKMRPFSGWWHHFRPIPLLVLGLKK
jgi:dolichol-phosphate mannosyltransferase